MYARIPDDPVKLTVLSDGAEQVVIDGPDLVVKDLDNHVGGKGISVHG